MSVVKEKCKQFIFFPDWMELSIDQYLISCVVVVVDERISHFNAGGEAVCPGLNLRLDVLMVGDDQPCRRNIPVADGQR